MSKGKRRWTVVIAVLLLGFGIVTDRMFVHPRLEPLPPSVDAIIELGGAGMAGRDGLALELASRGQAPYLVQSTLADAEGGNRCLPRCRP